MAEHDGEKSQDPTPHRRQQVREAGHVAHSQDLSSAGLLLGSLVILIFTGGALLNFLGAMLGGYLSGGPWLASVQSGAQANADLVMSQWNALVPGLAKVLLPVLGLILLLAIALNVLQMGVWFLPHKLLPDFSRVNPLAGLSRLFSTANAARLAFGVFKIAVVAGVAIVSVYHQRHAIAALSGHDLPQIASLAWNICLWTCIKIGIALCVLAILDYGYQRWRHEQDLKMTPQEMREEMRNLQGDPQVIARRRGVQRQLAMNRLSQSVPKADVVIANPAEPVVALRYNSASMAAPVVAAKGTGLIAARIRQLALENGIPIVEKPALAEALYKEVDLNRTVPDKLYGTVAEVLAYAYQLKNKS
ncbi:MAG: EscU/YscU/HrcU family type III secretion system export apparatus switch protein [Planctomycetia bacterium]|nr:EscU/YscU/HrcU family type III secretion system export apparatus switch protein [Planctomycetia bacterium]